MNKKFITIFSLSITAGTIYYGYSKLKESTINKLVNSWIAALEKKNITLTEKQQSMLTTELDKLFLWDIRLLANMTSKIVNNAPIEEQNTIAKKLKDRNIFKKADLKEVQPLFKIS